MKTTRFIKPDEKLSLVYTIGSYICACYPANLNSICAEVSRQYIGAEKLTRDDILNCLNSMIFKNIIMNYDEAEDIYSINRFTGHFINEEENKFELR
jgi:hypothetical protein